MRLTITWSRFQSELKPSPWGLNSRPLDHKFTQYICMVVHVRLGPMPYMIELNKEIVKGVIEWSRSRKNEVVCQEDTRSVQFLFPDVSHPFLQPLVFTLY